MTTDPFKPLAKSGGKEKPTPAGQANAWVPVRPVPDSAGLPPEFLFKAGKPTAQWEYRGAAGELLGFVCRFDDGKGGKEFRPLTFCSNAATGERQWRWKGWDVPRPLYGLDRLAARPDAPVIVCEGEKAADAAGRLFADHVALTSPNGSKAADKADWSALRGRRVTIWPDADEPGRTYALDVARQLVKIDGPELVCSLIEPPTGMAQGWDAADCEQEQGGADIAGQLLRNARSAVEALQQAHNATAATPSNAAGTQEGGGRDRKPPARDRLLDLSGDCTFWHDQERIAFATLPVGEHRENWPVKSEDFARWLGYRYYRETGQTASKDALGEAMNACEGKALFDGEKHETFLRVARLAGAVYLDLADKDWRAVRIDAKGHEVVSNPPVKFRRTGQMEALPEPEGGGMIEELFTFLDGVPGESDRVMLIAFMVYALYRGEDFRNGGGYPLLFVSGPSGAGKTTLARMVKLLIDPSLDDVSDFPGKPDDFAVAGFNCWLPCFDNLGGIGKDMSNTLCRLATGGSFQQRKRFSDKELSSMYLKRPCILNGLHEVTGQPDLARRSIMVTVAPRTEAGAMDDETLMRRFLEVRPRILSALLDALACALRRLPEVPFEGLPGMGVMTRVMTAAEPGLGWEPGTFIRAYRENKREIDLAFIEESLIGKGILDHVKSIFHGSSSELLTLLNAKTPEDTRRSRYWPQTPVALGKQLRNVQSNLERLGFVVEFTKDTNGMRGRTVVIKPPRGD